MALALSASLAGSEKLAKTEEFITNSVGNIEVKISREALSPTDELNLKPEKNCVPDVIMPNASCWWKKPQPSLPPKQGKRMRNRTTGKTALELTSDVERNGKISERVAQILVESTR